MLVIVGAFIVIGAVFGGYLIEGGKLAVLIQPIEFLIIGGAAAGSLLISAPIPLIKMIISQALGTLKGPKVTREHYTELLLLLFELCKNAKANPLSIEAHVEKPHESEIFKRYPKVLENHHALDFLCDSLKVQISSPMSPFDFEDLMDKDIAAAHQEEHNAPSTVTRIGDAMPGLGIVAAVLGVVLTMGKLTQGKEVIGHSVASALVGTFLGILMSYGFLQPLAAKMELNLGLEAKFMEVIKAGLLAYSKNCSPKVCVEFSRRTISPELRPSFAEVDQLTSSAGKKAAA
ncbi:MAG: flagellar motor stator protein MotA [Oligoflexia bacterium]|nr:flagellar motor stator protein MotA [Oligoflexia bacterium]